MYILFSFLGLTDSLPPERVIFSGPATIVFWSNGTKTVVKCAEGERYDKRTAILWAIAKNVFGSSTRVNKMLDELVERGEQEQFKKLLKSNAIETTCEDQKDFAEKFNINK